MPSVPRCKNCSGNKGEKKQMKENKPTSYYITYTLTILAMLFLYPFIVQVCCNYLLCAAFPLNKLTYKQAFILWSALTIIHATIAPHTPINKK